MAAIGTTNAGAGQTVAIVDTGVDTSHPFLGGRVVSEGCFSSDNHFLWWGNEDSLCPNGDNETTVTGSGRPCPISGCDHGTHVAGIAAGNGTGVPNAPASGVAPAASIIAIKVFYQENDNGTCQNVAQSAPPCILAKDSDVLLGLQRVQALRNTFQISAVNLSLGGNPMTSQANCDSSNSAYKAAIDNLRSFSIATVAASGNSALATLPNGTNVFVPGIDAPACISSAISVGRTAGSGGMEAVAGTSESATFLSLLAPGTGINSSVTGGGFGLKSGTSMATPHVTGAFALLRSRFGQQSVASLLNTLSVTGVNIVDNRGTAPITKPRIQLDAAFESLLGAPLQPTNLRLEGTTTGTGISVRWNDNSRGETSFVLEYKRPTATSWQNGGSTAANATAAMVGTTNGGSPGALTPNTTYQIRVKACTAAACSDPSNVVEWTTLDTAPSAPNNLRSGTVTDHSIEVLWDITSTHSFSRFEIRSNTGVNQATITTTLDSASTGFTNRRYTFSGLAADDYYTFQVRACNIDGCSAYSTLLGLLTRPLATLPPAPTNLRVCGSTASLVPVFCLAGGVTLQWNDNASDEDRYELEWTQAMPNTVPFGPGSPINTVQIGANAESYRMTSVTSGSLYYFRLRAHNSSGYSSYSNTLTWTAP
jgi:subtilisin family serine protease